MSSGMNSAFERAPFRASSLEALAEPAKLSGVVPRWLEGTLIRTCPAIFAHGDWHAEHWFDGLCMMYAFRIAGAGVAFQQRVLESETHARVLDGRQKPAMFGTPALRSLWKRVLQPLSNVTDNANVNVMKLGDEIVAMTETAHQAIIDPTSLAMRGHVKYTDAIGELPTTAHPQLDVKTGEVFNLAVRYRFKSSIAVIAHDGRSRERRLIGEWPTKRVPYTHSFGLTPTSVVILRHPFSANPLRMLWSNKPFSDHFTWRSEEGMTLAVVPRDGGPIREYEAAPGFVFHVINAFDEGEDVVVDALVYEDASIVRALSLASLERGFPDLMPKPRRYRLRAGGRRAYEEPLADLGFEFPAIDYRRVSGRKHKRTWGTSMSAKVTRDGSTRIDTRVHALDVDTGAAHSFNEAGFVLGEPVFVRNRELTTEGAGALLVVGSHETDARSALYVLDATTLDVLARGEVPVSVPLGFHGSFLRA